MALCLEDLRCGFVLPNSLVEVSFVKLIYRFQVLLMMITGVKQGFSEVGRLFHNSYFNS